jgi:hypothetical protein
MKSGMLGEGAIIQTLVIQLKTTAEGVNFKFFKS